MKRVWILLTIFGLAALSPAPIVDRRTGVKIEPEKSQAQRTQEQLGHRMAEVGSTPIDTERTDAPSITPESNAEGTVAAAKVARAADLVAKADKDVKAPEKGGFEWGRWLWGALILAAAFGLVQAFKVWANKALPDAPGSGR